MASYHAGLKRVHVGNSPLELIPVDICVKGMIIASERHKKESKLSNAIPVYNAAATRTLSVQKIEEVTPLLENYFFDKAIGTPGMLIVPNNFIACVFRFFLQILPALIIDGLLILLKRKPMVLKLQRILIYSENAVEHFLQNEFIFDNRKFTDLGLMLCKDDKEDFYMLPRLPMMQYFIKSFIVSKEIVCNETAESAARARKKTPYWKAFGWAIKLFAFYVAYKLVFYFYKFLENIVF